MKRVSNLFLQITDFNNLRLAYLKALKGKRSSSSAIIFRANADIKLYQLKKDLESQTYKPGKYNQFKIYDPKERIITAACFEDRIVHHAVMNILEPVFEKQFIFHTYACRKNKGTHKAVKYVCNKVKHYSYYLKLDVRKYFDSISHRKIKNLLCRIIKDKQTLNLLFKIIDSYSISEEKGLPIGNLTSQFFANFYLSGLDHYVLEQLKVQGYVRYMDDIIIFSNNKEELREIFKHIKTFALSFELIFKQPVINSCKNGVPFLGYLISNNKIKVLSKNRKRKMKKIKKLTYDYSKVSIDESEFANRLNMLENCYYIKS